MPEYDRESGGRRRERDRDGDRERSRKRNPSGTKHRGASSHALSAEALAALTSGSSDRRRERSQDEEDEQRQRRERREKGEKREKREKREKEEKRERRERRERREQREQRDRQQAEEREARRLREEARERDEREAALAAPRPQTDSDETERERRDRRRRERTRDRRDRTRSRHYTDDDRTDDRTDRTDDRTDDRRRRRHESAHRTRPERTHRPSQSRAKYSSLQTGHDEHDEHQYESDAGYDRVVADGDADRRHRRQRDRRIPSGAMLEEGRSRGVWDAAAAGQAAGAAAAALKKKLKAAAAPEKSASFSWRAHLRGGLGGQSSMSSGRSGETRNSMDRAKENLYYASDKQRPAAAAAAAAPWSRKKKMAVLGGLGSAVLILLIVVVAVVVSKKGKKGSVSSPSTPDSIVSDVPADAPSWLNPYKWVSVVDFNVTYTNETVGGLPVMGLNTSWDDSQAANSKTKALSEDWGSYGTTPARGVNLGGWLSLEPFITPSLFSGYAPALGIVDEYTLCAYLGADKCGSTLEQHYATFVTEATFAEIAAAGLDHVRIPYSYWAVAVYDDDPYVFRTSWRYLLRGIEWARRHGLRVNLDLHGLPGSQNGWNHSGRQGAIGWMNGTDGARNVQRSLDVHDRLSRFFAQARYRHVVSHYGLANEPRMTFLSKAAVMAWTQQAAALVRANGVASSTVIVFGDGFGGLGQWQGQPNTHNLALDVHQYEIFNNEQIVYAHADKIRYACRDWTAQTAQSMDTATGFGPTIVAEWSQADTDCAAYLGNVGNGNRWTGTYDVGNATLDALTPRCPAQDATCSCTQANADAAAYSDAYRLFLLTFAEAQMDAFERGWGWWYWTWDTEAAAQWSYKKGLAAGILPADASARSFSCGAAIPDFGTLPEYY